MSVSANQTSGQKNEPRSTSAQIPYSVHHNELQWVTVNYCAVKYCQLLWNTVDEKLSLNLSLVFNNLMICSVAGFRQCSTPRHDAVKLFFRRCFAPWRKNKHQIPVSALPTPCDEARFLLLWSLAYSQLLSGKTLWNLPHSGTTVKVREWLALTNG